MFDNTVTRHEYGINNERDTSLFSDLPIPSRSKYHEYLEDFDYFVAANYTVTKTNGSATTALANGDGGLLLVTNTTASADIVAIQKVGASFQLASGLRTWGKFIISVDSLLANFIVGLTNATTTPFTAGQLTDGVWLSNTGSALTLSVGNAGTVQTLAVTPTLVAASFLTFSFYWDGEIYSVPTGRVVCDVTGAGVSANFRGDILPAASFPAAVNLTPTWALQNSTAAGRTMTADQAYIIKERSSILATPAF